MARRLAETAGFFLTLLVTYLLVLAAAGVL